MKEIEQNILICGSDCFLSYRLGWSRLLPSLLKTEMTPLTVIIKILAYHTQPTDRCLKRD